MALLQQVYVGGLAVRTRNVFYPLLGDFTVRAYLNIYELINFIHLFLKFTLCS